MTHDTTPPSRKRSGRSPSYPGLDLEAAIDRVRSIYERERQHPTAVEMIVKHWGYKSLNGPASVAFSALKKYGLVADQGTGNAKRATVTDLAVTILEHPQEPARRAAIQQAALTPPIHNEMWQKYKLDLPSTQQLEWDLTRDRHFTDTGAAEFVKEYRATIAYAQLGTGTTVEAQTENPVEPASLIDSMLGTGAPIVPTPEAPTLEPAPKPKTEPLSIKMTLPGGGEAVVATTRALTEAEWGRLQTVLGAMKPTFVPESE